MKYLTGYRIKNHLSQKKYSQFKYIIIAERHPEIHYINKKLLEEDQNVLLLIDFYFKEWEAKILSLIFGRVNRFKWWIEKREIRSKGSKSTLIRVTPFISACGRLAREFGLYKIEMFLSILRDKKFDYVVNRYLQNIVSEYLIVPQTFRIRKKLNSYVVSISFDGSAKFKEYWESKAEIMYPSFPNPKKRISTEIRPFENVDKIVTFSEFSAKGLKKYGIPTQKIQVLPLGPMHFPNIGMLEGTKKRNTILYHGRLTVHKGAGALLELLEIIPPEMQMTICSPFNKMTHDVFRQKRYPNLSLIASASASELREELQSASIFVLPSFHETFSIALLEAMAFGLIPIVTKNSAAPEILRGTELEQFIVEPGDVWGIKSKLHIIYQMDFVTLDKLRKLSRKISEEYSYERFAEEFIAKVAP